MHAVIDKNNLIQQYSLCLCLVPIKVHILTLGITDQHEKAAETVHVHLFFFCFFVKICSSIHTHTYLKHMLTYMHTNVYVGLYCKFTMSF